MSAEQKKPYEKRSVEAGKKYEQDMAEYRKVSSSWGGGHNGHLPDSQGPYRWLQILPNSICHARPYESLYLHHGLG